MNKTKTNNKQLYTAKQIAITALFAATLTGGKFALSFVPNVEIVTILIAVYATVWGWKYVVPAVNVFVIVETLLYGFNTWVISYFVHWNCVAVVFLLLKPLIARSPVWLKIVVATIAASIITALFGVLTSLVDTLLGYTSQGFVVATKDFWYRFAVLYARGVVFFVVHIVSNTILFATAYYPLNKVLTRLHNMYSNGVAPTIDNASSQATDNVTTYTDYNTISTQTDNTEHDKDSEQQQ